MSEKPVLRAGMSLPNRWAGTKSQEIPMNPSASIYLNLLMPLLFLLMASFFIFIALKTLIARRPLVFSTRWLFAFICLGFLPSIVNPFVFSSSIKEAGMMAWFMPVMFAVMLSFFWIQMRGYIAVAISDSYFREALLSAAGALGYTIEETMSRLKIKETGQEMQVSIQGWIGTAQLKSVDRKSTGTVTGIANGMTQYFRKSTGKMNYLTSYFYLIMGLFMIILAIGMFTLTRKLGHH